MIVLRAEWYIAAAPVLLLKLRLSSSVEVTLELTASAPACDMEPPVSQTWSSCPGPLTPVPLAMPGPNGRASSVSTTVSV